MVLSDTRAADAKAIAERICSRIAALRLRELPNLRLTASIGLAETTPSQAGLRDWMNDADLALYRAKHAGRNQVADFGAAPAAPQARTTLPA